MTFGTDEAGKRLFTLQAPFFTGVMSHRRMSEFSPLMLWHEWLWGWQLSMVWFVKSCIRRRNGAIQSGKRGVNANLIKYNHETTI
jgi:hypothetical protein